MRTKTLLIAAAALAATVITSEAQVYSANVVGYATVPTLNASSYYLLTSTFAIGSSNGVNEVFGTTLPDFSEILTWDTVGQQLVPAIYDSTQNTPTYTNYWYQADDATPLTSLPTVKPGQGFFLIPAGSYTNNFAGTVAVNVGATNSTTLPNASSYYLLGSAIPYTGYVTNNVGLTSLPDFTEVLTWDPVGQQLVPYIFDTTQNTPSYTNNWYQADDATPSVCPSVSVGQGFFVIPAGSYTWKQTLQSN